MHRSRALSRSIPRYLLPLQDDYFLKIVKKQDKIRRAAEASAKEKQAEGASSSTTFTTTTTYTSSAAAERDPPETMMLPPKKQKRFHEVSVLAASSHSGSTGPSSAPASCGIAAPRQEAEVAQLGVPPHSNHSNAASAVAVPGPSVFDVYGSPPRTATTGVQLLPQPHLVSPTPPHLAQHELVDTTPLPIKESRKQWYAPDCWLVTNNENSPFVGPQKGQPLPGSLVDIALSGTWCPMRVTGHLPYVEVSTVSCRLIDLI